jgi:hypothetical protein
MHEGIFALSYTWREMVNANNNQHCHDNCIIMGGSFFDFGDNIQCRQHRLSVICDAIHFRISFRLGQVASAHTGGATEIDSIPGCPYIAYVLACRAVISANGVGAIACGGTLRRGMLGISWVWLHGLLVCGMHGRRMAVIFIYPVFDDTSEHLYSQAYFDCISFCV